MIAALTFEAPQRSGAGPAVRNATFVERSTLPLSAACLVANGVREELSRLLATELDVQLIEPAMPGRQERRILVDGATIYRVRGRLCDGFIIVRSSDARRLVAAAFGESDRPERDPLSHIESATLERIARALVPLCNALCGTLGAVALETSERAARDLRTYFEVRTSGAVAFSVGFALTHDPPEAVCERITLAHLADVELAGTVEFASGTLGVPAFSHLVPGVTIALDTRLGAPGLLRFGDVPFAHGTCGVANGRGAITFEHGVATGTAA